MNKFLEAIVSKLPYSLQPYAKALVPLALGAFIVVQDLVISVEEVDELKTLAVAAVVSLLTYSFPNLGGE